MNPTFLNMLKSEGLDPKKFEPKKQEIDWKAYNVPAAKDLTPSKPKEPEEVIHNRGTDDYLNQLITQDSEMLKAKELARKLASVNDSVLILGETGTGKELLARALHGKRTGRFLSVNCGGFPEYLVDSILFGHRKGSFTGADRDHVGVFISAQDGTVFLDEVAELPLMMQAKLLRVIQEHEVTPVGSNKTLRSNARIVCATNKDLQEMVKLHKFREDLFWRINTFVIQTIPLRCRPRDILLYLEYHKLPQLYETVEFVRNYNGNYRELQQLVRKHQVLGGTPTA